MKVILLENIEKLGNQGDVVNVKAGFARNFLFAKGLATNFSQKQLIKVENELKIINSTPLFLDQFPSQ